MIPLNPGAVQDRIDTRDYSWDEVGRAPLPFDWSKGHSVLDSLKAKLGSSFELPIKNQGDSSSCGGQAWASHLQIQEALHTGTFEERSARFIYAQTYYPNGGSTGRDNCKIVTGQGVSRETIFPSYENGALPSETFMRSPGLITDPIRLNAKLAKAETYASVGVDFESIATAVRDNNGAVIGIVGQNNGTWASEFPQPPSGGTVWGHWVLVVKAGLLNGKKSLTFANSWGYNVGNDGFQTITEDYLMGNAGGYTAPIFNAWSVFYGQGVSEVVTYNFRNTLRYGNRSEEVKKLQQILKQAGFYPEVPCTGFYGSVTAKAVLAFQLANNVATPQELYALRGHQVGEKTRKKLNLLWG